MSVAPAPSLSRPSSWRSFATKYRILLASIVITVPIVGVKLLLHYTGGEVVTLGSFHTSVLTGAFFVLGFILSATIADYKESERIPAEVASVIQSMHDDAVSIHKLYPKFHLKRFTTQMLRIAEAFGEDVRDKKLDTQEDIHALNESFVDMEKAGVPANFIVKLKQQQAQLLRALLRVSYIQRIRFVPSATILARVIVVLAVSLVILTEVEPFYSGLFLVAIISLVLIYVTRLIDVISTPFQPEGHTKDDVSMFLISQTADRLRRLQK